MTGITRRSVKQQGWWHIILLAVAVVTVLLPFCAAQEANTDKPTPTLDPQQEQALRQLVQGYVRAEKKTATYENVLEKVKLVLPFDNAQRIEQIVQEALQDAEHIYADRLILDMLQTVNDPDCMEREFDASSSESFNATDAAAVLHKCKLLVLRNVFDPEFLSEYKANFTGFVQGLKNGEISREGSTTNNEGYFLHKLDHGRWEVLLPQNFAHATVVSNPTILNVLMNDRILGPDLVLHSLGTALADSGARHQDWHTVRAKILSCLLLVLQHYGCLCNFAPDKALNLFVEHLDNRTVTFCLPTPCTKRQEFRNTNYPPMPLP